MSRTAIRMTPPRRVQQKQQRLSGGTAIFFWIGHQLSQLSNIKACGGWRDKIFNLSSVFMMHCNVVIFGVLSPKYIDHIIYDVLYSATDILTLTVLWLMFLIFRLAYSRELQTGRHAFDICDVKLVIVNIKLPLPSWPHC